MFGVSKPSRVASRVVYGFCSRASLEWLVKLCPHTDLGIFVIILSAYITMVLPENNRQPVIPEIVPLTIKGKLYVHPICLSIMRICLLIIFRSLSLKWAGSIRAMLTDHVPSSIISQTTQTS
jgi:hypothetical protein